MLVLYLALFVINIVSATEVQGKSCPYCAKHSLRCAPGHTVQNACVRCVCGPDGSYLCNATACSDEQKENVILGKPTQATCAPRTLYVMNDVSCLCSSDGTWPHDQCEFLFRSLHNKTSSKSQDRLKPKAQRCIPNSYFIHDCNVCKCSPEGEVERSRCTHNSCSKRSRRTYDHVHGTCSTGSWYSLAPCQFCYCHKPSKLVCSAQMLDNEHVQLGSYNTTNCGIDFLNTIVDVVPSKMIESFFAVKNNTLNATTTLGTTTAPTTKPHKLEALRSGQKKTIDVGDVRDADEDDDSNDDDVDDEFKQISEKMTVQPFSDSSEERGGSKSELEENIPEAAENKAIKPKEVARVKKPIPTTHASSVQKTPVQAGSTDPGSVSKVQISLPSMLQRILNFALRKSMVTVTVEKNCSPGSTSKEGCNYCFCLTNGKMLCTNKGCDEKQ